jgi:hypothetical protein
VHVLQLRFIFDRIYATAAALIVTSSVVCAESATVELRFVAAVLITGDDEAAAK